MIAMPADQAWFWSEHWQAGEAEVDEHVRAGQVTVSASAEDFLADLDGLVGDEQTDLPAEQGHEGHREQREQAPGDAGGHAPDHAEGHTQDHAG